MKSWKVHYMNKYPGAMVIDGDDKFDVFQNGNHRVSLRKNGSGQWMDVSKESGCTDSHDLAPIPKNARFMKLHAEKGIIKAEEYDSRLPVAEKLAAHDVGGEGKVPSIAELQAAGEKLSDVMGEQSAAALGNRVWLG